MKFDDHVKSFMSLYPNADENVVREVNSRIDQFAHFPNWDTLSVHRKFLHHKEGIEYFRKIYGEIGAKAAEMHIRQDCGHVPDMMEYVLGIVDEFGVKRNDSL